MIPRLFDDGHRTDMEPKTHRGSSAAYLNSSARPLFAACRDLLEGWFARYPRAERARLRIRLRSDNDALHQSAFFELCLHEVLVRLGCQVEVEPETATSKRTRPDFCVTSPTGVRFYLEATVATDEPEHERAARARLGDAYDAINSLNSPNFYLDVHVSGTVTVPLPASKIRRFLAAELAKLDPDDITQRWVAGADAVPRWALSYGDCTLMFRPIPKRLDARGAPESRPLGSFTEGDVRIVDPRGYVRKALLDKAGRYGVLDRPYIIAINTLGDVPSDRDMDQVLLGDWLPGGKEREQNGLWSPIRYTRVSAVLVTSWLYPWTTHIAGASLWLNPWAAQSYPDPLTVFPVHELTKTGWQTRDAETLASVLGPQVQGLASLH